MKINTKRNMKVIKQLTTTEHSFTNYNVFKKEELMHEYNEMIDNKFKSILAGISQLLEPTEFTLSIGNDIHINNKTKAKIEKYNKNQYDKLNKYNIIINRYLNDDLIIVVDNSKIQIIENNTDNDFIIEDDKFYTMKSDNDIIIEGVKYNKNIVYEEYNPDDTDLRDFNTYDISNILDSIKLFKI